MSVSIQVFRAQETTRLAIFLQRHTRIKTRRIKKTNTIQIRPDRQADNLILSSTSIHIDVPPVAHDRQRSATNEQQRKTRTRTMIWRVVQTGASPNMIWELSHGSCDTAELQKELAMEEHEQRSIRRSLRETTRIKFLKLCYKSSDI
jgi:hypothetical protein